MLGYSLAKDIKFFYQNKTAETLGPAEIEIVGNDLVSDSTLETAFIISAFSDRRADEADQLPSGYDFRHGWWGSRLAGFEMGSKVWLLNRARNTEETAQVANQYFMECWQWMIDDKWISSIDISYQRKENEIEFKVVAARESGKIGFKFQIDFENREINGVA